jgi:hypothetical protein
MTEREDFDAWFEREFDAAAIAPSLRNLAFHFWRAGRRSVLDAKGAAVEMRCLPEPA